MNPFDESTRCSVPSRPGRSGASPGSRSHRIAPAALLAALALALWPNPATAQWQPDRFQFFCGSPYAFTTSQVWLNVLRNEGWVESRHAKDYRTYLENLGRELDDAAPGCLEDDRLREMEDMAHHALLGLKALGSQEGIQFEDPSPERLGPVFLNAAGDRVARIYVDPQVTGIGSTNFQTKPGQQGIEPWSVAHVRFGVEHMRTQPAWSRYRTIAHELVHVITAAQPIRTAEGIDGTPSLWVGEGTADALAADLMRQRGYGVEPPLSVRGSRSVYGLRPYNRALTWVSGANDRDEHGNVLITHYTASSFFAHLADRYFGGSLHYLVDWFNIPPNPMGDPNDWLQWADDLLRYDTGGIDQPFYLVFPDFLASYASWGEKKYPHIGEEAWMAEAFGGCYTATVSPTEPTAIINLELEPFSAHCLKVIVGNVPANQAVSVQLMAYGTDTDRLDNLHLTASRMESTVGGRSFDCYDEAQRSGPSFLCLHKPFTGAQGGASSGAVTESGGRFVKAWLGVEQVTGGEGLIENTYLVVHAPVEPRDAQHDVEENPGTQTVRLQVGLERSELVIAGSESAQNPPGSNRGAERTGAWTGDEAPGPGSAHPPREDAPAESPVRRAGSLATASINGSAGLGLVPMRGGDAGGDGPFDLANMITSAMESATDPEAMSRGLFLQNQPMGTILPGMDGGPCPGICLIMIDQKEERPDGYGGYELATTNSVGVSFEEPIPFGATGTFEAMVSACPDANCERGASIGAGTVTIMRFDDTAVHLRASGFYCAGQGLSGLLCRERKTFETEVLKPFGWAYGPASTFHSIDTPGMQEYREHLSKVLAEMLPGTVTVWRRYENPSPGESVVPEPAGSGGGGGGGEVVAVCDCTCGGFQALMAAIEAYEVEVEAAAGAGRTPPPPPPEMQMLSRCTMECAMQWGTCGGSDSPPPPGMSCPPGGPP
ncbi:MAG: hypothetical protein WD960_02830 [Gemmatimonadota bacterium]